MDDPTRTIYLLEEQIRRQNDLIQAMQARIEDLEVRLEDLGAF